MSGERHPSLHATALATGSGGFLLPATIADQGGKASKRILSSGNTNFMIYFVVFFWLIMTISFRAFFGTPDVLHSTGEYIFTLISFGMGFYTGRLYKKKEY